MRKIKSAEFKQAVSLDPAWATKLTEPVEITDFCDMTDSKITHLSPLLHFTGKNIDGTCAYFQHCKDLKVAEGTFHGAVSFFESGIEKIDPEKLVITGRNNTGEAASFCNCGNLRVAEGKFNGHVDFSYSGIEEIHPELEVTPTNGCAASFMACLHLKIARGTFHGYVDFSHSHIERIDPDNLIVSRGYLGGDAASFKECEKLTVAEGTFPGSVDFEDSGVVTIGRLSVQPNENGETASFEGCSLNAKLLRDTPKESLESILQGESYNDAIENELMSRRARKVLKQPSIEL